MAGRLYRPTKTALRRSGTWRRVSGFGLSANTRRHRGRSRSRRTERPPLPAERYTIWRAEKSSGRSTTATTRPDRSRDGRLVLTAYNEALKSWEFATGTL